MKLALAVVYKLILALHCFSKHFKISLNGLDRQTTHNIAGWLFHLSPKSHAFVRFLLTATAVLGSLSHAAEWHRVRAIGRSAITYRGASFKARATPTHARWSPTHLLYIAESCSLCHAPQLAAATRGRLPRQELRPFFFLACTQSLPLCSDSTKLLPPGSFWSLGENNWPLGAPSQLLLAEARSSQAGGNSALQPKPVLNSGRRLNPTTSCCIFLLPFFYNAPGRLAHHLRGLGNKQRLRLPLAYAPFSVFKWFYFPPNAFQFQYLPRLLESGYGLTQVLTPVKASSLCWWSLPGTFFFSLSLTLFFFFPTARKWKWNFLESAEEPKEKKRERKNTLKKQQQKKTQHVYRTALNTHSGQISAWGFQKKLYLALHDPRTHTAHRCKIYPFNAGKTAN